MSTPLDCELHDYIEIACLFQYRVRLTLSDRRVYEGRAITTSAREGEEYLVLRVAGEALRLPIHQLAHMSVLTHPARFSDVTFR